MRRVDSPRAARLAALRVPLVVKLVGANLLVIGAMTIAWRAAGGTFGAQTDLLIGIVIAVHSVLVLVALRPVRELEAVASRVWNGDYGARVQRSSVADAEVLRVGSMFNILLDSLATDRARMRDLVAQVIAAGDRERAALARELHESVAQRLAGLQLELAAAARDTADPSTADRLDDVRGTAEATLQEVRAMSQTLHPGVLDDLGLEAAIRRIGRELSANKGIDLDLNFRVGGQRLPRDVEAVLYRVAQEAIRNATVHASARHVWVSVQRDDRMATLNVHDDGVGFDLEDAQRRRPGLGLTAMRERVELVDGVLDVKTAKGSGTTITATVPLDAGTRTVQY